MPCVRANSDGRGLYQRQICAGSERSVEIMVRGSESRSPRIVVHFHVQFRWTGQLRVVRSLGLCESPESAGACVLKWHVTERPSSRLRSGWLIVELIDFDWKSRRFVKANQRWSKPSVGQLTHGSVGMFTSGLTRQRLAPQFPGQGGVIRPWLCRNSASI